MRLSDRPPSSGAFANMLRDFDAVREFFTSATITALVDLPFSLLFLFFVYQLGGGIAFILLALVVIVMVIGMVIQIKLKSLVMMATKTAESKHGILVETIHGLEVIKASGADGRFRSRYGRSIEENAIFAQKSRFLSALGVNIATFFQQIASVIIILTGMYLVKDGDLSTGGLIACVILGGRAIAPIGQVANLMTRYHQAGGALKTLNQIMSQEVERPEGKSFLHRPSLDGAIKFDGVSFSYPATNIKVLDKVSFTIGPGEKVGIIGKIGSGKSTIAKLMAGLYTAESGQILFDNTDSRQIDPADLRKNMAYIAQDVILFRGSVRENITAGYPDASEQEILKAAELAGVHEFIARHPMGYDAPVGENGSGLSGGQKQAVALARALIKTPNMIICDEPTNAMDVQAETVFCNSIKQVVEGRTLILITHKNSMLPMLDRLILVHGGKILMDGPRDEVLRALDSGQVSVQKG
ncbi:MAG: peptidase domain-containing ABC transporter, partial [Alphaproteobacteria bacterium]|nr:peptidase domain-containing ABC transporter [Alphaproteobacteria bacterium]